MTQTESLFFGFVGSQLKNWCWSSLLICLVKVLVQKLLVPSVKP